MHNHDHGARTCLGKCQSMGKQTHLLDEMHMMYVLRLSESETRTYTGTEARCWGPLFVPNASKAPSSPQVMVQRRKTQASTSNLSPPADTNSTHPSTQLRARPPPNSPVQLSVRPLTSHVLCARRIEGVPRGPASPGLPRQPRRLDRPACLLPVGHSMQRSR